MAHVSFSNRLWAPAYCFWGKGNELSLKCCQLLIDQPDSPMEDYYFLPLPLLSWP